MSNIGDQRYRVIFFSMQSNAEGANRENATLLGLKSVLNICKQEAPRKKLY